MKTPKRLLASVASLTAAGLVLAACSTGGGAKQSETEAAETFEPGAEVSGTLTFWHSYGEDGAEVKTLEDVLIPAFEEAHPGTTIKAVQIPSADMHQKLVTSASAGSLPDVIRADIVTVPELASLGTIVPLSEVMPDFQEWADQMFPGPLETNRYGDSYWGLPLDTNTRVVVYTGQGLEASGISKIPSTLEEYATEAAKTNSGTYLFAESGSEPWNLLPFIWSNGGEMTDADYTTSDGYLNGEKSVEAIQMLVDLYNQDKLPGLVAGGTGAGTWEGLVALQYASMLDGPWAMPVIGGSNPELDLQTAPMFSGDGGSISVVGGEDLVVTEQSENKALAIEFLRYMLSEEAQVAMGEVGQLSAQTNLTEQMLEIQPYYKDFLTQLETARPRPVTPQWAKINDIFVKQVQRAFLGEQSVQDALDEAVAQIDPLLKQS